MTLTDKQIPIFLTEDDEAAIAALVVERLPGVRFLDQWHWERPDSPPVRSSPLEAGLIVGIWASDITSSITGTLRADGVTVDGPREDAIVQWIRCKRDGDLLKAGRWAARYDPSDKRVAAYVRTLWRLMTGFTVNTLTRISGDDGRDRTETRFRAGPDAYRLAAAGEIVLAADALRLAPAG